MADHSSGRAGRELTGQDTIAALATAPGRGAVAVIRISGPDVPQLARSILGCLPEARYAHYAGFRGSAGETLDWGLALYFPRPRSFTGEDVLELHAHGGPVIVDRLLRRAFDLGARQANPGEFSERAFLNGKLDLTQAEAIADLIESRSEWAARAAVRSLTGEFAARLRPISQAILGIRAGVEAALDFPDEDLDLGSESALSGDLKVLHEDVRRTRSMAVRGALLRDGMTLVIAGRPNVGKSTLLNALAERQAAIVTEIPGTTRDVLRESIHIDGMPLHVLDTAGLRDAVDAVEREGVRRAWEAVSGADRVLLVVDDTLGFGEQEQFIRRRLPERMAVTVVRNKIDLSGRRPGCSGGEWGDEVALSAHTGLGVSLLREHLKACMSYGGETEGMFSARRRHLEALERTERCLMTAVELVGGGGAGELVAEELRLAHESVGQITGEVTTEDMLDEIFSTFCLGK